MKLTKIYDAIDALKSKDSPNHKFNEALSVLLYNLSEIGAVLYAAEGLSDPSDQLRPARNVTHYVEKLAAALEDK